MARVKSQYYGEEVPTSRIILTLLGLGALLTMTALIPVFPMIIAPFMKDWQRFDRRRLRDHVNRLHKRGMVDIEYRDGDRFIMLTDKGKLKALKYQIDDWKKHIEQKWDGKWRIISFDITEDKKKFRDAFRRIVKYFGFYQIQKSVFVYPYDCEKEIDYLRKIYDVDNEVLYFTTNKLDYSYNLIRHFKLQN